MRRVIVSIITNGTVYELGKVHDGLLVKAIEFKRDGLVSINADCGSSYQIVLQNPMVDKEIVFKIIPFREVKELLYINSANVEVDPAETAKEMKRVE